MGLGLDTKFDYNSSEIFDNDESLLSAMTSPDEDESPTLVRFINATLIDDGKEFPDCELWVDRASGLIVPPPSNTHDMDYETVDVAGNILSPGFLDVQINGAFGLDFSNDTYGDGSVRAFETALHKVAYQLLRTGVTGFCPTLPSTYPHVYRKVLPSLSASRTGSGADSLGVHLEGPFLSPKKPGCHPQDAIKTAPNRIETFKEVYGGEDNIRRAAIITVAAEQDGVLESIADLRKLGPQVSLGHSVATYEKGCEALAQGANMVTHIYNAMTQPHHRHTGLFGLLGATKKDLAEKQNGRKPFFGMIVDGIHVHPSAVNIAYHANTDGCCLVTDAMFPMGLPSGNYPWGKQSITKDGLLLHLNGTSTIAGSAVEIDTSIRNLVEWADISLADALKTVTTNPAKSIGLQYRKGTLRPGADADITILDRNVNIVKVYKLGRLAYNASSQTNSLKA